MDEQEAPVLEPEAAPTPDAVPGEGLADLAAAFGEAPPAPAESSPTEPDEDAEETPAGPPAEAAPVPADALSDPYVQQVLAERAAQEAQRLRQQEQAAEREAAYQNWLKNLPDAELGRYMRERTAAVAQYNTWMANASQQFFREATVDVQRHLPEFKSLSPEAASKLDPRKFSSYGEMVAAWVDHVAEARATRRAESLAEEKAKARVADELARLQAEYPKQPTFPGGAPGRDINFDAMDGEALLRAGFSR